MANQHQKNIETHNEKVKKNREILRRLIDVVCFLSEQQLAFRGHDESADFDNEGNYVEILHLCKKYDPILSNLQEEGVFSGTSNRFQNDLINSVAEVLLEKIKSEINDSTFVAIILDEATEIRTGAQLSFVIRYVLSDGNIAERFLGFLNVSFDRTASGLSKIVFDKIEELKIGHKFVAHTYDGASVMPSELNGLQKKVKEKYPHAFFVHCMAHRLNLVLSQAAANIQECDKFFSQIKSFSLFFCKSTKRVHLDTEIKKRFPKVTPTRWNLNHSLVETVREYHEQLADLFLNIIDNSSRWDTESYTYAQSLYSNLQNCEFNFLLNVFGDIFIYTNTAFDILQENTFDVFYCIHTVNEIVKVLKEKKQEFSKFWANVDGIYPQIKKRKTAFETEEERYRQLFYKIIDLICEHIEIRFQNLNELHFLALLDPMRQSNNVQETSLTCLKHTYEDHFDSQKLRSELTALYKDAELKGKSIQDLLYILRNSGLDEALPQLTKLCELILTLPTISATVERSSSYLNRIHSYTRNSQGQERSSSLALIGIEKAVLKSIKNDTFYNDVINNFNKKERRIELTFK
ncbi:zinc finger MYM-type protein 1 [Octopus bimaculoides]|uniref:zinc finger MYM-type protein 1 n=1 Tax=Octopus bimaculoides TaxID=37653 RepID=UPI00071D6501|nr:zinc finger MYM-type protein 1 [Octopus bimaculoides]|eukprot:XP_014778109.1 PREDICTED: zinc finger MYM-type protein 1-like [Octopus bimaculoides]